mmetsp:Transcript_17841/g.55524  ORF Transcript_17841/g.55524 Transcript_17841/m.55524 type:complete len:114 (+) Transcript_17841:3-344(+)
MGDTEEEPETAEVSVIVTVRHGPRLRWRVDRGMTVEFVRREAEMHFNASIACLRSVTGAAIEHPERERVGEHVHELDQSLAFFQAVPEALAQQPATTMMQSLWDTFANGAGVG